MLSVIHKNKKGQIKKHNCSDQLRFNITTHHQEETNVKWALSFAVAQQNQKLACEENQTLSSKRVRYCFLKLVKCDENFSQYADIL